MSRRHRQATLLFISFLFFFGCGQKQVKRESDEVFYKKEAQRELEELPAQSKRIFLTQKHVIGCILPLSGKYASFGERSLRGIQLALSFFEKEKQSPYALAIYDSQGDPGLAAAGVEKLLENHGVIAVIGPLLTETSEAAAIRAQQLQLPMINLSQHKAITQIGDAIFRIAMTRKNQVNAIAKFACETKGFRKFAILYSEDSYGIEFANLFWDKIGECGGTIEGIEVYKPGESDFNNQIKKLVGLHQPKARREEYLLYEEQAKIELNREEVKESQVKLPPKVDFEALFIPDYAITIGQIAPTLSYYDVENVALLGTEGWNSPKLLERGQEHVEGAVFVDGFFKDGSDPKVRRFVKIYEETFGKSPAIWEAQAYDATELLLTLLGDEEIQGREDLKERLNQLSEFSGVTGEGTFEGDHDINKNLILLTVQKGKIRPYLESE